MNGTDNSRYPLSLRKSKPYRIKAWFNRTPQSVKKYPRCPTTFTPRSGSYRSSLKATSWCDRTSFFSTVTPSGAKVRRTTFSSYKLVREMFPMFCREIYLVVADVNGIKNNITNCFDFRPKKSLFLTRRLNERLIFLFEIGFLFP